MGAGPVKNILPLVAFCYFHRNHANQATVRTVSFSCCCCHHTPLSRTQAAYLPRPDQGSTEWHMIAHSLGLSTVTQRPLQDHFVTTLTGLLVRPGRGVRQGEEDPLSYCYPPVGAERGEGGLRFPHQRNPPDFKMGIDVPVV